jgi:acetylornithine/N-succinyldiaminopimelate aminotransferase
VGPRGPQVSGFRQGWAVNCQATPRVWRALTRQAQVLITPSPAFFNEPSIRLAQALTSRSCFDQVFFANTGAEANENAIKLARKFGAKHRGGAYEIITFQGAFHGRTLATMSASGKPAFEALFEPKVPGFPKAQLNDLASVERLINDKTVGVMLE